MIRRIRAIDAHAGGEPLRLIVSGFPSPAGANLQEKRGWVRKHADGLRRALLFEPRGHRDMYAALLTEAVTAEADAGLLFMHGDGYPTMSGHGVIAATTIALERSLLSPRRREEIVFDTPAGAVHARPLIESPTGHVRRRAQGTGSSTSQSRAKPAAAAESAQVTAVRVSSVAFTGVPSFIYEAGVGVRLKTRPVRADIAFGGVFYAIVDAEGAGLSLEPAKVEDLRRLGSDIRRAIEATRAVVHPLNPALCGVAGTIFIAPARSAGVDLRTATVFADGAMDRSPSGTGTAAVMAVLDAMSLLASDRPLVLESVIGTTLRGRVVGRQQLGDYAAIVPEVEGSAWITAEHEFVIDDADPLHAGFRLGEK